MEQDIRREIITRIIAREDPHGCWNVDATMDGCPLEWTYYVPTYSSTIWTLVFLADLASEYGKPRFRRPLEKVTEARFDPSCGIFTIGASHFPIPCLNGNMLYLHQWFGSGRDDVVSSVVDFFCEYQRFDDGDFKTPSAYPYCGNRSCYGGHTCYWGVVKLLKGLSFIPRGKRSVAAVDLLQRCIDFVLKHRVCFSSHDPSRLLNKQIGRLTFPHMYQSDYLEILWLLAREGVHSDLLEPAVDRLRQNMQADGTWLMERTICRMVVPWSAKSFGNYMVTQRASEVLQIYG